jgi:hypothetical protein
MSKRVNLDIDSFRIDDGDPMAQNHYTSKTKRRPKNSNRKDTSAATMAALRKREEAAKK